MGTDPLHVESAIAQAARKHARRVLAAEDIESQALETLVAAHTAATRAGWNEQHALEAAAGIARNGDAPQATDADSLAAVLMLARHHPHGPLIAGVNESLRARDPPPPRLTFEGRSYQRRAPQAPLLVGVDEQQAVVERQVAALFAYVPEVGLNAWSEVRHKAVLLYGPPGTGKSSLCRHAFWYAAELSKRSGVPVRQERFGAADYSKWVGESAKNLAEKLERVADPSGVGLLVVDDADMLLSSRQQEVSSAGLHHVTAELMQWLSGMEDRTENVLVLATTNRPEDLDHALDSRWGAKVEVPLYATRDAFVAYVDARLPQAEPDARVLLADAFHAARSSPRSMDHACRSLAEEAYGRFPLDALDLSPEDRYERLSAPAHAVDAGLVRAYLGRSGALPS